MTETLYGSYESANVKWTKRPRTFTKGHSPSTEPLRHAFVNVPNVNPACQNRIIGMTRGEGRHCLREKEL